MSANISSWAFGRLFIVIGVLNAIIVHPVPATFYILLSILYFLPERIFTRIGMSPMALLIARILIALVVLWGTLAVGDLAEHLGL